MPTLVPRAALLAALVTPALLAAHRGAAFRNLHQAPVAPTALEAAAWPVFRGGPQNTGRTPLRVRDFEGQAATRPPSKVETGGLIWGTPVSDAAGNVYVGSADKVFYALDPQGQLRWTYTLPDAGDALIDSAAALAPGNLVVVPGGDGRLHALDRDSGAVAWVFAAHHADDHEGGETVNSFEGNVVVGPDGNIYAGSDNGWMYSLTPAGEERWAFETGMMIWSAAAFSPEGDWMAFGSLDRKLYVLDPSTGALRAKFGFAGEVKSSPAVDEAGRIYIGSSDFSVRCLELTDGLVYGERLKQRWRFDTRGEVYGSPALADGKVVIGSHDGYVYCLTRDGELVWKYGVHARISASPLVTADGVVFVGAKNGAMYALDLATGERRWSFKAAPGHRKVNLDSSPALSSTGVLHVGSYDGHIYRIPVEYPGRNGGDPRVSLDPGPSLPDFGGEVPVDGGTLRVVDATGAMAPAPAGLVGPEQPLALTIVGHDEGRYVPNAAIASHGMRVTVDPPTPVDVTVGSDGYSLHVTPKGFWAADTEHVVKVEGRFYHRGNPFVDLLKWFRLPRFTFETRFRTAPRGAAPVAAEGETLRYAIRGLYATRPELLDTLIPAAMDGQAFVASFAFHDPASGKAGAVVLPGYPQPDGSVVIRPAPEKVFPVHGFLQGDALKIAGTLKMAAMGGTIPLSPFRVTGRLSDQGIERGRFHGTAPVLGIKGNGGMYTGLSWSAIDDMADSWLRLQAFGTLQGFRVAPEAPPATLGDSRWADRKTYQVGLDLPATVHGAHLVTVAFWDPVEGEVVQATQLLGAEEASTEPGRVVLRFPGLKRSALQARILKVLVDGQVLAPSAR